MFTEKEVPCQSRLSPSQSNQIASDKYLCSGCNTCTVTSMKKIDVALRIKDLSRLIDVTGDTLLIPVS
jgi:MinD superfamily P-loop ATPase